MTKPGITFGGALLTALVSAACSDDSAGTSAVGGDTSVGAGGVGTGGLGAGGTAAGVTATAGAGIGGSGAGGSAAAGAAGNGPTVNPLDQSVRDLSESCVYSSVLIEIDAAGDAATEAASTAYIKKSVYDRSMGTKFSIDTVDGDKLELTWQPPARRPDMVDFTGVLRYTAEGGNMRSLCITGRLLDAFNYPVENFYPFAATTVFDATAEGDCTTTAVNATLTGCFSENYNLR